MADWANGLPLHEFMTDAELAALGESGPGPAMLRPAPSGDEEPGMARPASARSPITRLMKRPGSTITPFCNGSSAAG